MGQRIMSLAAMLVVCLPIAAKDYEPKICPAAVPYVGEPTHAPVPPETFSNATGSIEGKLDPALTAELDEAVAWILQKTPAPGLTAAVAIPGKGLWSTSSGIAVTEPRTPVTSATRFHWASIGKAFTAAVILQLIEDGKLKGDDSLARWFPDFPNAKAITIEHLLTHTNGIFTFDADKVFQREKGYHAPEKLIAIAERHGSVSCPGERWYYSNTGYVMLAMIVERVEGKPFHEVVKARILDPLGMKETIALSPGQKPSDFAIGHVKGKPDTSFEVTTPFGAGNIIGTASDMVLFWQGLLTGKVISQSGVVSSYGNLYPMFGQQSQYYGRGVMLYEFQEADRKHTWLGHSGGTPGIKSVVAYDPEAGVIVAVALNGDAPAEACANKLIKIVAAYQTKESGMSKAE